MYGSGSAESDPAALTRTRLNKTSEPSLGYCYDDARLIKWMLKQAARGFQGVSGSFED